MAIEGLSEDEVLSLEIPTGAPRACLRRRCMPREL